MARIRTIKPEFFTSEQVADCSPTARYLFIGMWCFCDDQGIHPASLKTIKMELFPSDDLQIDVIKTMITEIISAGLMIEYEVDDKRYWQVTGWKHQKIEKPNRKHPLPDQGKIIRRPLADQTPEESKGREGSLRESKGVDTPPPPKGGERAQISLIKDLPTEMAGFDDLWSQWPRKEGKKAAQKAWPQAKKKVSLPVLTAAVGKFVDNFDNDHRAKAEKMQFCKHFSAWLNGERWKDYDDEPQADDASDLTLAEKTRSKLIKSGLTPLW